MGSFKKLSSHSPTTGITTFRLFQIRSYFSDIQRIMPLCTVPTACVLVRPMGVSTRPHSETCVMPDISPAPLSTKLPAINLLSNTRSLGRITVTPVLTGPWPGISLPSPRMTVVWPTRTPLTSVIALYFPGGKTPISIPSSLVRGCFMPVPASCAIVARLVAEWPQSDRRMPCRFFPPE